MNRKNSAILLFLIGCFSLTQVRLVGRLGISEFVMLAIAPLLFCSHYSYYRQHGMTKILWLSLIWLFFGIFTDWFNHITFVNSARGLAVPAVIFSTIVCIAWLLRKDPENIRWLFFGLALSNVITIFVFQRGGAGDMADMGMSAGATERVLSYKLFWVNMLSSWATLPIIGWYLKAPQIYIYCAMAFVAGFSLMSGGRASFLVALFSFALLVLGRKNASRMIFIKKHIVLLAVLMLTVAIIGKSAYKFAVANNYLGDAEKAKYEVQTQGGDSALRILMSGRSDFFVGLIAAFHRPVMGHGSHAPDTYGYMADFLASYGNEEDYRREVERMVVSQSIGEVSAHSHLVTYWDWHGIGGLVFWVYVLWLLITTLLKRMHVFPPYFGLFAVSLPSLMWDVLFSPLGLRTMFCAVVVACLIVKGMEKQVPLVRHFPVR